MTILVFSFLIGVIAGLRAMMAPAIVSWAAGFGRVPLEGSPLHFMSHPVTRYIFGIAALGELVNDKLPKTPSRKAPAPFIARVITGALSGAALGASQQALIGGLIAGAVGAGRNIRRRRSQIATGQSNRWQGSPHRITRRCCCHHRRYTDRHPYLNVYSI
jgi:uncharacterized membrane protein